MTFAEKIYTLRKQKGLSQEQLADALGVSRQAISKWESGVCLPETEKLALLSNYLNVSIDQLLKDDMPIEKSEAPRTSTKAKLVSILFFIASAVCIVILAICLSATGDGIHGIDGSSVIVFNEKALLLMLANAFFIAGIIFLIKHVLRSK